MISYLPMAHLADRGMSHYGSLISGACATFVSDMQQVMAAAIDARPTVWGAVPRVWEKLKAALEAGLRPSPTSSGVRRWPARWSTALALVRAEQAGEPVASELRAACERADAEIFCKLRTQLGLDQVRSLISGAAPNRRRRYSSSSPPSGCRSARCGACPRPR